MATITSGDVVEFVKGTGTLTPLRSVDVGTQVSGIVKKLHVDFNSIVKKGQLLAELDPALFQTALDSAQAMVDQAQIALDQQRRFWRSTAVISGERRRCWTITSRCSRTSIPPR